MRFNLDIEAVFGSRFMKQIMAAQSLADSWAPALAWGRQMSALAEAAIEPYRPVLELVSQKMALVESVAVSYVHTLVRDLAPTLQLLAQLAELDSRPGAMELEFIVRRAKSLTGEDWDYLLGFFGLVGDDLYFLFVIAQNEGWRRAQNPRAYVVMAVRHLRGADATQGVLGGRARTPPQFVELKHLGWRGVVDPLPALEAGDALRCMLHFDDGDEQFRAVVVYQALGFSWSELARVFGSPTSSCQAAVPTVAHEAARRDERRVGGSGL